MCGRFALATPPEDLRQLVDFSNRVNFPPRYNIAPTQPVSIIRAVPGREMALVQWGLIAPWLKPEQQNAICRPAQGPVSYVTTCASCTYLVSHWPM